MRSRMTTFVPILTIIAVSFIVSYLLYTTGSFAVSAYQNTRVDASGWASYQVWTIKNDTLSGSFEVTTDGVLDFYIMSENDYRIWTERGGNTGSLFSRMGVESLEWSVLIPADGTYFIVYSNWGSSVPEHVQASLHVTTSRSILWPVIVTGTILTAALLICMTTIRKTKDVMSY
ncbi:MAG: hypothetical protein ACFFEA_00760 [Candidatus Thorarchaeota archaeon]